MGVEYYSKFKNYYMGLLGLSILFGIFSVQAKTNPLFVSTISSLLIILFIVMWGYYLLNRNNKEYFKKDFEEKRISRKEYDKNVKPK